MIHHIAYWLGQPWVTVTCALLYLLLLTKIFRISLKRRNALSNYFPRTLNDAKKLEQLDRNEEFAVIVKEGMVITFNDGENVYMVVQDASGKWRKMHQ